MLSLFSVFFIQCQGLTREGDRGVLQSAEQGKPRAARQPPEAYLPGLPQAAGPDSRMERRSCREGTNGPQGKLLATWHVNASRPHADSGLPSRLSLDLSQASPKRRKAPTLLTHFNPTPGGLDQTLQEVPAATAQRS